ncbi:TspO/MBR family protein [Desulfatitalea alkaliphila]|uniref:Tryptophan-rich sensory protein n=1 Tax=Desulfatitalea alkaliphila TaxID=2929485 RepID=A0AA41R1H0_9BACT|nr:TspO/MBR family protein [Desulfatitalea alkaliphila]MCJ8500704.1 tryptophan-rich sensory protein [Desulfatitalea alkaliphila]
MKVLQLIIAILIAQCAGLIGSLFTTPAIPTWYAQLVKPVFTPPGWLFGPVWLSLYSLMGIASFWIWRRRGRHPLAGKALVVYGVHLAFNALWSVLFFGLKNPGLAFVEIVLLWGMIGVTGILFFQVDRRAAYLLVPYWLWVSYAAVLNFSIWQLN